MARRKTKITLRELGKIAFLCLVIFWLSMLIVGILRKEQLAQTTVKETRAELAALAARTSVLSETVHDLDTERGHEASLRETFGVAKPGEEVIVVVPKKELPPPPVQTFWDKVKDFFKK